MQRFAVRRILPLTPGAVGVVILAILGVLLLGQGSQTALAQDPDGVIVGIDVEPTGNTATSLAAIDRCRSVAAGDIIDIDVWVDDMEDGPWCVGGGGPLCTGIMGAGYNLGGWPASGADGTPPQITAKNHLLFLNAAPGSAIAELSEAVPDGDDPYLVGIADFGTVEYVLNGYTEGVIGRYTLDTTGAAPSVYGLTLAHVDVGCDIPPDGGPEVSAVWDSAYCDAEGCYGLLAVDTDCPGAIGGIVDLQSDRSNETGTPHRIALVAGIAAAIVALTAGAWYARRGRLG